MNQPRSFTVITLTDPATLDVPMSECATNATQSSLYGHDTPAAHATITAHEGTLTSNPGHGTTLDPDWLFACQTYGSGARRQVRSRSITQTRTSYSNPIDRVFIV